MHCDFLCPSGPPHEVGALDNVFFAPGFRQRENTTALECWLESSLAHLYISNVCLFCLSFSLFFFFFNASANAGDETHRGITGEKLKM